MRYITPRARGRAVRRTAGEMNKTEAAFAAEVLGPLLTAGAITAWWFDDFTFRLAKDCRYTPDFVVMMADGLLKVYEVKGHMEEDALVKIKMFAQTFPFDVSAVFRVPKREGGGWKYRTF